MKVLLILWWILLGSLPFSKWGEINQDEFMNAVAQAFATQNQCSSEVVAMTDGDTVAIFGRCLEVKNGQRAWM